MGKRDFAQFVFKMRSGWISHISQGLYRLPPDIRLRTSCYIRRSPVTHKTFIKLSYSMVDSWKIKENLSLYVFPITLQSFDISFVVILHRLLNKEWILSWWRHQMETFFALLAICAGNSPVPGELPTQTPVTRSFDVFFDLRLNRRLSKQWWGWWFETLSRPLWRHRNVCEKRCHGAYVTSI